MVLEHLDKALADNSGRAQDSYGDFRSHMGLLRFYNTGTFLNDPGHLTVLTDVNQSGGWRSFPNS